MMPPTPRGSPLFILVEGIVQIHLEKGEISLVPLRLIYTGTLIQLGFGLISIGKLISLEF